MILDYLLKKSPFSEKIQLIGEYMCCKLAHLEFSSNVVSCIMFLISVVLFQSKMFTQLV